MTRSAGTHDAVLSLKDVSVSFGDRQVLREVTFSISAGEFTGLIGSNGAGKTTLLRVILGLQPTNSGSVVLGRLDGARRGASIGYVPQKIVFDSDMPLRARDIVALGFDGHRLGIPLPSRDRRERVDEMLQAVDAERFANERIGTLSGGEQQRVLIAHALVGRPRLLLLDEPLANLDLRSSQEVSELLARLAREHHIAVLISAHDMNPLIPFMDRIVYVAEGRAASGTTDEVVRQDVLTELYGHHVDVIRIHNRVVVVAESVADIDARDEQGSFTDVTPGVRVS
ncbi:MAG: metal ABC transporter ATP-binding protein [Acidimicrobiales bacterium]